MKRVVLAAIDLNHPEDQKGILKRAHQFAKLDNAALAVATVLPDYKMSYVSTFFTEDHTRDAVETSRKALHELVSETIGEDEKVKHIVRMGNVYEEVLHVAQELDCSLIVVGAHRPEISNFLLGPNAARIARHARCSVFVLRPE